MKIIIQLSLFLLLVSCATKKKIVVPDYKIIEGSDLFYSVKMGDEEYEFNLNMNEFTEDVISFDWDLGFQSSGTTAMNKNAITHAMGLKNYFTGGYQLLQDQTAVWLSIKLFNELKSGKSVAIDLGKGQIENFKLSGPETFSFGNQGDGVPYNLPVFIIKNKEETKEIWVHDNPNNRLIVKMKLEFSIGLVDWKL